MKRVLYVTSKWPSPSDSSDGGDSTVAEVISALNESCKLDLLCFRKKETCQTIESMTLNQLYFVNDDFNHYSVYPNRNGEKFFLRLKYAKNSVDIIRHMAAQYEIIVLQHCQFAIGFSNKDSEILKKVILFPMFTGTDYIKAGEYVPSEYIEAEKNVLKYIHRIIAPSYTEKMTLISDYKVDASRIQIIPRSIQNIQYNLKDASRPSPKILYVASIRKQKAHIDALKLINALSEDIPRAELHCVGTIQDEKIYQECCDYCKQAEIENRVFFHGLMKRQTIKQFYLEMDINISISKWETFGRGVFEGMASGLPTIVLNRLECMKQMPKEVRPILVSNIYEMKREIIHLVSIPEAYKKESAKGEGVQGHLSLKKIQMLLRASILF